MRNNDLLEILMEQMKIRFEGFDRLEAEIKTNFARLGYEC